MNPHHLFLGTDWDNVHDAMRKGRMKFGIKKFGESNPFSKYTTDQIKKLKTKGEIPKGMSKGYAYAILKKIRWGHVK